MADLKVEPEGAGGWMARVSPPGALMPQRREVKGLEGIMRTREGLIDALAEAQRKREYSDC